MNILYFTDPSGILDRKYIDYFSSIKGFNIFILYQDGLIQPNSPHNLSPEKDNVKVLPPIKSFSLRYYFNVFKTAKTINRLIYENNIELVHVLYASPNALWLNYLHGIKSIITTRGSDILITIPDLLKSRGIAGLRDKILFSWLKKAFKRTDFITCTSNYQKLRIKDLMGRSAEIIRTGINFDKILNTSTVNIPSVKGKRYILFPRSMNSVYNHELEVSAIELLDKSILENFIFIFLQGKKPDFNYLHKINLSLKKIKGLEYEILEFILPESMYSLTQNASLSVMVPHSDGTPNSALEAMAFKVPLILGNFNYDEDIFNNSCLRLHSNDPKELADLIYIALNEYPENLLMNGFQKVHQFADWKKEMAKIHQIYLAQLTKPIKMKNVCE